MPQSKVISVEKLEEATIGRSNGFLIQCLSDWMSDIELEEFAQFVEDES